MKLRNIAVFGTLSQIALMGAIGYGVGHLLGLDAPSAVTLALAISLSSTMVVLKTLNDRGDLLSLHGRILTGMLLVQDLAFIPMIAVLPALSGEGGFLTELFIGLLKAAAVLGGMALLGGRALDVDPPPRNAAWFARDVHFSRWLPSPSRPQRSPARPAYPPPWAPL